MFEKDYVDFKLKKIKEEVCQLIDEFRQDAVNEFRSFKNDIDKSLDSSSDVVSAVKDVMSIDVKKKLINKKSIEEIMLKVLSVGKLITKEELEDIMAKGEKNEKFQCNCSDCVIERKSQKPEGSNCERNGKMETEQKQQGTKED